MSRGAYDRGWSVDCMSASDGWLIAASLMRVSFSKFVVAGCLPCLCVSLVSLTEHPLSKSLSAPLVAVGETTKEIHVVVCVSLELVLDAVKLSLFAWSC